MKKSILRFWGVILAVILISTLFISTAPALAAGPTKGVTIQDGVLTDSAGNLLSTGYDKWGYNYQAMIFNGFYENYSRPGTPVTQGDIKLQMKWNDAWLSNMSRDGDLKLDRHYGYQSYIGSGAWLTNHMQGTNADGTVWTYFCKIVAAPADAKKVDNVWYTANGTKIGPVIWGEFAVIQEISNDPATGDHGVLNKSPVGPGLGKW